MNAAKQILAQGYPGLFLDGATLDIVTTRGTAGLRTAPKDVATSASLPPSCAMCITSLTVFPPDLPMTVAAWESYMATYLEQIRQALPGAYLCHNALWWVGGATMYNNSRVVRQMRVRLLPGS